MALVKCADCGNQISDRAPACPTCGAPLVLANVTLYLEGIDRALIGKNDLAVRVIYNGAEHSVIEQGGNARITFPSGGNFDFSCDLPTMTMRRKTQTLSYAFPDGFQGGMKFAIETGMFPKLVTLKISE